jgi:hypothetical protein
VQLNDQACWSCSFVGWALRARALPRELQA